MYEHIQLDAELLSFFFTLAHLSLVGWKFQVAEELKWVCNQLSDHRVALFECLAKSYLHDEFREAFKDKRKRKIAI